jgi:hypothetical protein
LNILRKTRIRDSKNGLICWILLILCVIENHESIYEILVNISKTNIRVVDDLDDDLFLKGIKLWKEY